MRRRHRTKEAVPDPLWGLAFSWAWTSRPGQRLPSGRAAGQVDTAWPQSVRGASVTLLFLVLGRVGIAGLSPLVRSPGDSLFEKLWGRRCALWPLLPFVLKITLPGRYQGTLLFFIKNMYFY